MKSVNTPGWTSFALAATVALTSCGGSTSPAATFTNPVYRHTFPDPFVLRVGHTYYAYATGNCRFRLQGLHSHDLVHWGAPKELLSSVPRWAADACDGAHQNRLMWAPEVLHRADGKYLMYYVAHRSADAPGCISYAVSSRPDGPFVDTATQPFECGHPTFGAIDPDVFRDRDGRLYLYWKNEVEGQLPELMGQRLSATGTKLLGKPARLVSTDQQWEANTVEAPTMWRNRSSYYLFFSGSDFETEFYAVGYANCAGPLGPCKDAPENPILHAPSDKVLKSRCKAAGPGHQALLTDTTGQTWIIYHAWLYPHVGDDAGGPGRVLWIDRVDWKGGKPTVHGPTCTSQPSPPAA